MFNEINKNRVTLEFIANGVLVILPVRNITTEEYDKSQVRREAMLQSMFENEMDTTDPELRRLQGTPTFEDVPESQKYRKMTVKEISDQQVFQFANLVDALTFIQTEFSN